MHTDIVLDTALELSRMERDAMRAVPAAIAARQLGELWVEPFTPAERAFAASLAAPRN